MIKSYKNFFMNDLKDIISGFKERWQSKNEGFASEGL